MTEENRDREQFELPIEWHIPEDMVGRYATHLAVQFLQQEFIISFFEIRPPMLFGPPAEVQARLKEVESVRAHCIARIIVAEERMPAFLKVLQEEVNRRQKPAGQAARFQRGEEDNADGGD